MIFGKSARVCVDRHLGVRYSENSEPPLSFDRAIVVDEQRIERFCLAESRALTHDLMTLCGAIWWADRKVTRNRGTAWARRIELSIPVFEHDTLSSAPVQSSLLNALRYLTGDEWLLTFTQRQDDPARNRPLPFDAAPTIASMPFSDGLDSFAQFALLAAGAGNERVVRVQTSTKNRRRPPPGSHILAVPITVRHARREPSFRTRPFVFFTFAALAAVAAGTSRVVIAENGQGSLAPSLMPFGNEWPFRSTHPGFVRRLQVFLDQVMGATVRLEQPQLWRTKAEVLRAMAAIETSGDWASTESCSNNQRYQYGRGIGCGICGGCMLRRVSVAASGLPARFDRYACDIGKPDLQISDRYHRDRLLTANEADILRHTIRAMSEFPNVVSAPQSETWLRGECAEMDPSAPQAAQASLARLAFQHKYEWTSFVQSLPSTSALRKMVAA